jgi:hypothetical protein
MKPAHDNKKLDILYSKIGIVLSTLIIRCPLEMYWGKKRKVHWEVRITTNLEQFHNAIRSSIMGQREYSTTSYL